MKVTKRTNEYGHEVIDCPFCEGWVYLRDANHPSQDPLRDLKRHIVHQAKAEAFEWMMAIESIEIEILRDLIVKFAREEQSEFQTMLPVTVRIKRGEKPSPEIKHLEYTRDHYDWKPQRNGTLKRQFDNDIQL